MFVKLRKKIAGSLLFAFTACGISLCAAEAERMLSNVNDPDDAVSRLFDRETRCVFQMVGRGSSAKWCIRGAANFDYMVIVQAQSRIEKKTRLSRGRYEVVEKHTFEIMSDKLSVSKADISIQLDNFDSKKFDKFYGTLRSLILLLDGPGSIVGLDIAKSEAEKALKKVDGISITRLLEEMGLPGDAFAQGIVSDVFQQAFNARIRPLTGKTYKVIYTLGKNKLPISMSYTYEDGMPVTSEEERMVLDRLNAFIDTHTVPDRKCRVGDEWPVHAGDIEQVMDPYVDGHYIGDITVKRAENDPDGSWNLAMDPTVLSIVDDKGNITGSIRLEKGSGKVDPQNCTIEDIRIEGAARMNRVSSHHWLFQSRIAGWCQFVGKLKSIRR